jgi:hypothetical protein
MEFPELSMDTGNPYNIETDLEALSLSARDISIKPGV